MKTSGFLKKHLLSLDRKGYPAYKELTGIYDFGKYYLSIDYVQGDPFASPSRLSVHLLHQWAEFPKELFDCYTKRITLQDHLTRLFAKQLSPHNKEAKGSGKSGLLSISFCGQKVLERTACQITEQKIILRFEAGFPARGRTIDAKELEKMLFQILPSCVEKSLYYQSINKDKLIKSIQLCEDQSYIRAQLKERNLCAFIANGSLLPRESGVTDLPMKNGICFQSPSSLEVSISLPNRGTIKGMGIPKGITLFVGGGYHGKSTVLQALQEGVYNHIPGDGRELVITEETAFKLRAEDGRSISQVDISPFIQNLPGKKDTQAFSTEDASGSTSQAANLMEGIESGCNLFLIDEDTSATNFMIRDQLMQSVVSPTEEPIIPFIQRAESLYRNLDISSIIVAGSSGSFFSIADRIIQMKEYLPYDITQKAKEAAKEYYPSSFSSESFPSFSTQRCPVANPELKKNDRIKIKAFDTQEVSLNYDTIELRYLEQLIDREQTIALGYLLKYAQLSLFDGKRTMDEILSLIEHFITHKGMEALFPSGKVRDSLARPRKIEIAACINRYRKLLFPK